MLWRLQAGRQAHTHIHGPEVCLRAHTHTHTRTHTHNTEQMIASVVYGKTETHHGTTDIMNKMAVEIWNDPQGHT